MAKTTLDNLNEPGRLPCGCSPGKPVCGMAFVLLHQIERTYLLALQAETWRPWQAHELALTLYQSHFGIHGIRWAQYRGPTASKG